MHKRKYIPVLCFLFVIGLNLVLTEQKVTETVASEKMILTEPVFKNIYQSPIAEKEPEKVPETFIRPLNGGVVTSPFGPRTRNDHQGIDIGADSGSPIFASMSGTVTHSGWLDGYGYTIILQHTDNTKTLYAHCSTLCAEQNQSVVQGDTIAEVGSTGISTGPHLHFEIIKDGVPVDPAQYIAF